MWFGVLGPVEVRRADGSVVPVGAPRLRALLALLVLDAGRVVGQDRIVDGLYGEDLPANAANAVQSQVSRLRRVLPEVTVEFSPAGYRLLVDPSDVDVHRCAELVGAGRPGEALSLWRGRALADVDAPFADAARLRLEELRLDAAAQHGDVAVLRELVAAYPLRESLRAALMRALHRAGRGTEAFAEFEDARRLLAEELGVDPSPELRAALVEDRRRGLPAQLTSFVGRADEVRKVGKWLREARLVTLIGPGGAGKTRLAVEVASLEPDDVFFADLAPLADGVAGAVLTAAGVRETGLLPTGQVNAVERLVAALGDRPVLLVVDNCEHVVDEAAELVGTLLRDCPQLRVLATSREALGITGETLCPVPPLELTSGTRLFLDRALAVRPDFRADEVVVQGICQALDGIPLAIELAAARVRSLPLGEIAARLDDRFRLLSRGSRTAAPRHRTLHAVVEWSWDLLTTEERTLAARLTVFSGGASLAAVRAICGSDVDVLSSLVDKSLVEVSGDRYRMLDTIRAFCAGRATEDVRPRHAAYFLDLAQRAEPHLRRAEQLEWLRQLTEENDNLTAAVRWAIAHDRRTALELIAALTTYWWFRGLRSDGARLAEELLRATGDTPVAGLEQEYAMALLIAWPVATGDQSARIALADELMTALDAPPRYPITTMVWGMARGAPSGIGEDRMERRYELLGDDPWSRALAGLGEGLLLLQTGDKAAADRSLRGSLAAFREVGDRWGAALVLSQLAEAALVQGRPREAIGHADEAVLLVEELEATEDLADLLCVRAEAVARLGDLDGAHAGYVRAAELARRAGSAASLAIGHLGLAALATERGRLAEAREQCDMAWVHCPTGWYGPEETRCHIQLQRGRIAVKAEDFPAARAVLLDALGRAGRNHVLAGTIREILVAVPLDLTDEPTAHRLHHVARRAYQVEADLIGTDDIPPLHETLDEMRARPLTWFGVPGDDGLPVAFLAWSRTGDGEVDIDRLCVDPDHARQGHATRLIAALPKADTVVATGVRNIPAVTLYENLGFHRTGTAEPVPGLEIVLFRRPAPATTATAAGAGAG